MTLLLAAALALPYTAALACGYCIEDRVAAALKGAGAADGTSRVALPDAACSLAFDPSRASLDAVVATVNRPLANPGLSVVPLRVIDAGGKLREP
jgi:hypothetical protein